MYPRRCPVLGRQTELWPKAFRKPIMRFVSHGPCHPLLPYPVQFDDSDIVLKGRSLGLGQAAASHF